MRKQLLDWNQSMDASLAGRDYPEGKVSPADPEPINWYEHPSYQPYLAEWKLRWEYASYLNTERKGAKAAKKK